MSNLPFHRARELWEDAVYALRVLETFAYQECLNDLHDRIETTLHALGTLPSSVTDGLRAEEVALDDEDAGTATR